MPTRSDLRRFVEHALAPEYLTEAEFNHIAASLEPFTHEADRILAPGSGEVVAVTRNTPKTAALLFDRVYAIAGINVDIPREVAVFGATEVEVWTLVAAFGEVLGFWTAPQRRQAFQAMGVKIPAGPVAERVLANALHAVRGWSVTPVFASSVARDAQYAAGDKAIIAAAIADLDVVDEQRLDWEQVMDFRHDLDARRKYRRLVHWLDREMLGKPPSYIADEIAQRLDDYSWSIKKHGLVAVNGTLSSLLDPAFLAAASGAVAASALVGSQGWAALAAGLTVAGRTIVTLSQHAIDFMDARRNASADIAFVQALKVIDKS